MKVLLIKPPLTLPRNFKGIARFFPPIGLGYIAAVLEKNGHEVKILDAGIEKWNKKRDKLHQKYQLISYETIMLSS